MGEDKRRGVPYYKTFNGGTMSIRATLLVCGAALTAAAWLLHPPAPVHAQAGQLQIASISVSPDQTLTYPNAAPASPYLTDLPDEHTTFIPPASGSGPYLIFGSSALSTTPAQNNAVVLQSTDLQTFSFATSLGYQPGVLRAHLPSNQCNATYAGDFEESYAGVDTVLQDPALPAGNLIMLYEAESWCPTPAYVPDGTEYQSTAITRSSDNGKTWPSPGDPGRYPVIQAPTPLSSWTGPGSVGTGTASGFIDKSADGNYYMYTAYSSFGFSGVDGKIHVARAPLSKNPLSFQKWYNGSFSQPGINGLENGPGGACPGYQSLAQISYLDDLGLYLMTMVCANNTAASPTAAWYWSTATSLDLQDWTPLQMIANSQFPLTACGSGAFSGGLFMFDGWYPSFMSPGKSTNHLALTGNVFFLKGCQVGTRTFASRTFTIATQAQSAPVLTSGSLANGATYLAGGLVPGSWAQVQGVGLSNVTRAWAGFDFLNLGNNLPTGLSGVQVMVNKTPAPVYYISPTQIDFQVPNGVSGTASVQVIVNGVAGNTLTASAPANSPGLFPNTVNGVTYPAAIYSVNFGYVGPNNVAGYRSAAPGNFISLYATGLTSEPAGVIPTAATLTGVTVTVGSTTVPASFAEQTPYVGEFQINFQVPNLPGGNYPISIAYNGVSSPIMVGNPPQQIVLPVIP
jgi:uncharacterized protein (TIGR03437 family)